MRNWISFATEWPPKTDFYYVSWNLKMPRICKVVKHVNRSGLCKYWLEANKSLRGCLIEKEIMPTHWAKIKENE